MVLVVGVLGASLALAQQPQPRRQDMAEYLPPGAGKALVAKQCSACHDLQGTIQLRKSREAWEAIVLDMVARGAPLMLEEVDPLIAYLAEVFGPKAPPLLDVNAAGKDDLLRLAGVTPEAADRLIAHRAAKGPFLSRDEVRSALGLDAGTFDKIKYYLRTNGAPDKR
jgi:hypothetical protein